MAGELAWFELGVEDAERGRAFYEGLFGWRFEPGPSGDGWLIHTPTLSAGMHPGDKGASPYVFFRVDDMDVALARVRELGGAADDIPIGGDEETEKQFGRFKFCRDDQGSPFGLYEPPER